jgi:hypothetical protein
MEMSDFKTLIKKEKERALLEYDEDAFRLGLKQKISEETKSVRSYVRWFQKPAIAGCTVLLLLLFGWISTKTFLPVSQESEIMLLKSTFVRLFSQHNTILDHKSLPAKQKSEQSAIHDFEWSLKRVILAIQREKAGDKDNTQNFSLVLQNAAVLFNTDTSSSGELNM